MLTNIRNVYKVLIKNRLPKCKEKNKAEEKFLC